MDINQLALDTAKKIANIDPNALKGGTTQATARAQCLIRDAIQHYAAGIESERDAYKAAESVQIALRENALCDLEEMKAKCNQLEAQLKTQAKAAQRAMDAAKKVASSELEQAKRLHAESSPEVLESEREANAQLTADLHAALEREAALVAHVEQLSYVIVDAKRCAAVLAFPSNYNASDYQSFADAVMGNIETLSKQEPTNALTRRDLIKQAEGAEMVSEDAKMRIEKANAIYPKFDNSGYRQCIYTADSVAANLRQQAEELNQ